MKKASFSRAIFAFAATAALVLILPSLASALSFQESSQSPLPEMTSVESIATGDFNEDGDDDIAAADSSGVVIWLSNGDGTFTKGETLPLANVLSVLVGDFNEDGVPDLAYTDGSTVYIALGNGDGSFEAPDSDTEFSPPFHIGDGQMAVADFNEDGADDLVVTGGIHNSSFEDGGYEVYLSNGDGSFTAKGVVPVVIPLESEILSVAVGDYDSSGSADLALLTRAFNFVDYSANEVLGEVGKGDGSFEAASENPISVGLTQAGSVDAETTADLNGAGGEDLLVTTSHNDSVVPLLGSSNQFLTAEPSGALENGPGPAFTIAAADLDGNGYDDAVPGYFDGHGSFGVGLGQLSGFLTPAQGSPFRGEEHFFDSSIATGDFNGDGYTDVAIGSNANTNGGPLTQGVEVLINSPELGIDPEELEFGEVPVGETVTEAVTLTGLGAPEVEIGEVELDDPSGPFSIVDPDACESLAYEEDCEIEVEYAPIANVASDGTLLITANDGLHGGNAISPVPLSGQGTAPEVELSPASEDFGTVTIGDTPATRTFEIESTGNAQLEVTGVSLSSEEDFKLIDPSACIGSLEEGESCVVEVSFEPAAGGDGQRSATLEVETDAGEVSSDLTGTAENPPPPRPEVRLSPAGADFGSVAIGGTPVTKSFEIESIGNAPLEVLGVSLFSEADFILADPSSCVGFLDEGESCQVDVTFAPTGAAGEKTATLAVETVAGALNAHLTGTAEAAPSNGGGGGNGSGGGGTVPGLTAKLKLQAPGTVVAGRQVSLKVQVTNTGNAAISGLALKVSAPKSLAKVPRPVKIASLAAGQSVTKTIKVKVKSSAPAGKKLKLSVAAAAAGATLAKASRQIKLK